MVSPRYKDRSWQPIRSPSPTMEATAASLSLGSWSTEEVLPSCEPLPEVAPWTLAKVLVLANQTTQNAMLPPIELGTCPCSILHSCCLCSHPSPSWFLLFGETEMVVLSASCSGGEDKQNAPRSAQYTAGTLPMVVIVTTDITIMQGRKRKCLVAVNYTV